MIKRLRVLNWLGVLFIIGFGGCASAVRPAFPPPLILISMDAFRWDYPQKYPAETPNLHRLMNQGVSAKGLIPVFPSNTFPNHYSIVTGLYPSHHGIINNHFFDPAREEFFHYNQPGSRASYWWGGEPIWVTAIKQGRTAATSFWVGSEAEISGIRPSHWKIYDPKISFDDRLDELIRWMQLPEEKRPAVIAFYFEETNSAGHKFGPDSPQLAAAVKLLDGRLGQIIERIKAEKVVVNVILVSDHGMTPISTSRVAILDDYLDLAQTQIDFEESAAGLRPLGGYAESSLLAAAKKIPHATAYRVADLPARFHLAANPRNPPVWIVPDEGWELERRALFERYVANFNKGDHGYDPAFESMHGIFVANGPSFRSTGEVLDRVENIHIYNLMCAALNLTAAPNDGDDRLVRAVLKDPK